MQRQGRQRGASLLVQVRVSVAWSLVVAVELEEVDELGGWVREELMMAWRVVLLEGGKLWQSCGLKQPSAVFPKVG